MLFAAGLLNFAPVQAQDAQTLVEQGRGDAAVQALEAQVGTNPFDPLAMNNLAAVKAAREDWFGAAKLLVRAHRLAPGNAVIDSNLKRLNEWLARRAEAAGGAGLPSADAASTLPPEPPALWPVAPLAARPQSK